MMFHNFHSMSKQEAINHYGHFSWRPAGIRDWMSFQEYCFSIENGKAFWCWRCSSLLIVCVAWSSKKIGHVSTSFLDLNSKKVVTGPHITTEKDVEPLIMEFCKKSPFKKLKRIK